MTTFYATQGFVPSGVEIPGNVSILGALTSRVPRPQAKSLYARRAGGSDKPDSEEESDDSSGGGDKSSKEGKRLKKQMKNTGTLLMLMVVVFITIIIFVTVISAYDIIREKITNIYAKQALRDKRSGNKKEDLERTIIANEKAYDATVTFGIFSIMLSMGILPILFVVYYKLANTY